MTVLVYDARQRISLARKKRIAKSVTVLVDRCAAAHLPCTEETDNKARDSVTMTLDEIKKLPPLSEKRKKEMEDFKNKDFSDCPKLTREELSEFKPWYAIHPEWAETEKADSENLKISVPR